MDQKVTEGKQYYYLFIINKYGGLVYDRVCIYYYLNTYSALWLNILIPNHTFIYF